MATKKKGRKTDKKKFAAKKKAAAKLAARKATSKTATKSRNVARSGKKAVPRKRAGGKAQVVDTVTFEAAGLGARSGGQSGDLQGLSNFGRSSSESVDELLEEGNSFEAEVVKGVEDAGDAEASEVHTHQVPEDDVPGEYLDKD